MKTGKENPFISMFVLSATCAIMYCIAFHWERDKAKELEKKLEIYKVKK